MHLQAVLLAGDRAHSKSVRGRSKAFVEVDAKPMVVHVLEALLHTRSVSEIFVVGNAVRLEKALAEHGCVQLAGARGRPVHIVPQRDTLYENIWHTFLRTLPPLGDRESHPILVVPADIPLVVPEEIDDFAEQAARMQADYVIGLSPDTALARFAPTRDEPGIEMAMFNLAEGRYRQNNLHYVRPLMMGARHYIQDMYENRYQKEFGAMLRLAARVIRNEFQNLWVLFPYLLIHMAGVCDRRGYKKLADRLRARVPTALIERGISALLRTRVRVVSTGYGGAAADIDNDGDLAVAEKRIRAWKAEQSRLAVAAGE